VRAGHEDLGDAVDEAMNATENAASPITEALRKTLLNYLNEVTSSQLIQHVDKNPFGVPVTIETTLGDALSKVRDTMPA